MPWKCYRDYNLESQILKYRTTVDVIMKSMYKLEIESLKRELAEYRRGNNGYHSDCKYYDEEAREEVS
ncbi:truncted cowpox A-type inclusion protein [Monkeypox virus]|uniref:Truncted cowpox A-type inclusion protein n=1 Tax=Monkeypox virus TaxID=10244 RepID=M1LKC8_MONPV|nr:truncted cowpox A-type inclusion protein [Monkeypox virus]